MNKKIYFDNNFVQICDEGIQPSANQLIINYELTDKTTFQHIITNHISGKNQNNVFITCKNGAEAFETLKSVFFYIEAAGGIIKQSDKYLFIYRFNKWDLPKGKIEKGEKPEEAAIRECEEECAITGLQLITELPCTHHMYPYKNNYAIKTTFWYLMQSNHTGKLVPQKEEGIQKAEWMDENNIRSLVLKNTYPSVIDLISGIIPA